MPALPSWTSYCGSIPSLNHGMMDSTAQTAPRVVARSPGSGWSHCYLPTHPPSTGGWPHPSPGLGTLFRAASFSSHLVVLVLGGAGRTQLTVTIPDLAHLESLWLTLPTLAPAAPDLRW